MAFVSIPGIQGQVFVPDQDIRSAKHPCRDCFACQQCSDDRCRVCRREDGTCDAGEGRTGDVCRKEMDSDR